MPDEVQDKKAELGINVSVIIQTLLLASTIGFGTSIVKSVDALKDSVSRLTTVSTLNQSEIRHNREMIEDHINNDRVHVK